MSTTPDQKLDELFAALRSDSPAAYDHDLAALLRQTGSPTPDPLLPSTQQRKRKPAMISIITIAFLTAVTLLTQDFTSTQQVAPRVLPDGPSTAPFVEQPVTPSQQPKESNAKEGRQTKKLLSFSKAVIVPNAWVSPSERELPLLGIDRLANGDILLDDGHTTRLMFGVDTFAKAIAAKSTLNVPFTLFPKFITDTKGNLVMIGEHTVHNGRSSSVTFIAGQPSAMPSLNYLRTTSVHKQGGTVDTSVVPPIMTTPLRVSVGIMTFDTTISFRYGDLQEEKAIIEAFTERVAAKDSIFKLQFGGEAGLKAKFGNALSSDLSPDERLVLNSYDSLGRLKLSELQKVELQFRYLGQVLQSPRYSYTTKLKFEQLHRSVDYKFYLLKHKEDEKKFAKIDDYVPVLIRPNTGSLPDPTYDNGLIFWFEPSEELHEAMPSLRGNRAVENDIRDPHRVVVYPNPTIMYLFVQTRDIPGRSLSVDLQNLLGFNVLPSCTVDVSGGIADTRLDVSAVPPGIYFLTLTYENGTRETRRIVVQ